MQSTIQCPHCKKEFELSEAFREGLTEHLRSEIEKQVQEKHEDDVQELEDKLKEEKKKRKKAEKNEIALRLQREELEEREESLELEIMRRLDDEKKKISEKEAEKASEQLEKKEQEHKLTIESLQKTIDELKRKAEQGSQQLQGEVAEIILENMLKDNFPNDEIDEVPKGVSGADVLQKVYDRYGRFCGTIIWESKRTKRWNAEWLDKLKTDRSNAGAEIAAIVSESLPEAINSFNLIDDVWVSSFSSSLSLAVALRENLIQVARLQRSMQGQGDKMQEVYTYLVSPQFKNHVTHIVEAFQAMEDQIAKEKRAMEKQWKVRHQQIAKVITSTTDMRADLEEIIGNDMPKIAGLELDALPSGED